jgi:hypothetical protein
MARKLHIEFHERNFAIMVFALTVGLIILGLIWRLVF